MRTISELAPWLMIAIGFVFFAAISAGCRFALKALASPERSAQLEDHADKLLGVFGATFAFSSALLSRSPGRRWAQAKTRSTSRHPPRSNFLGPRVRSRTKPAPTEVNNNLRTYLHTVVNKDGPALADGNFKALPSAETFDTLQNSVHQVASGSGNADPVASGMVSAAASLTAAQSKVTAVAQRSLPTILITLIVLSGALLAATVGMSALTVKPPYLMYAWAFLAAVSVAVVLMIDYPFSGGVTVSLGPLSVAADSI